MVIDCIKGCVGCGCCVNICPQGAIEMKADKMGFLYPAVDFDICIDCSMCYNSCPLNTITEDSRIEPVCYGAKNLQDDIRQMSSSGGIFYSIAMEVINRKGVVFGAIMDEAAIKVYHSYAEDKIQLLEILGSKYVQSEIRDAFSKVKEFLENERWVLFSGTNCQIEGLRNYLHKEYKKLILIDVVCHGVPSPFVWKKYKEYIEEKNNARVKKAFFRDKETGWDDFSIRLIFENGKYYSKRFSQDAFGKMFLANRIFRESCESCKFKTVSRNSDITIGDLWGAKDIVDFNDEKGISLVMINTEKGAGIIEAIKDSIYTEKIEYTIAVKNNPYILRSIPKVKLSCRNKIYSKLRDGMMFDEISYAYSKDNSAKGICIRILKKMNLLKAAVRMKQGMTRCFSGEKNKYF